jgi:hypothetical protein
MPVSHRTIPRLALGLFALALALGAAGCAMSFNARSLGVPASMSAAAGQAVVGDTFQVTLKAVHLFWGVYAARVPKLQSALAGQLVGGREIQNLGIRIRRRWSDVVVTGLTLGLVSTASVTFEGIVTRGGP